MNNQPPQPDSPQASLDRLADQALLGPSADLASELDGLEAHLSPELLEMELAAAAAALALLGPDEPLPLSVDLAARIERDAPRYLPTPTTLSLVDSEARPRRVPVLPWLGWVAAAAALAFIVLRRPIEPPPAPGPLGLMESLEGSPRVELAATEHPLGRGAGGSLVWNAQRQEGYLALDGLAPVDPERGVYQLWIFDATRDQRYPVDGGVFTVSDGRGIVPIRAAVPVREPTLFAITLEPPGGVVVSDRQRILLTANWPPPPPG